MCRLRCGCAQYRFAACAVFALLLAGCAANAQGPRPSELLGAGGHALDFRLHGAPRRLTSAEQDLVVARAIAAHEMRNP